VAPVLCKVQGDAHYVRISITDKGVGVPKAQMRRIWGFAASGETGSSRGSCLSGFGVGLPLSLSYMRYFGGDLSLSSTEGKGSVAQLLLSRDPGCEHLPRRIGLG
jgi:pyruvate dehydrogenase kinase 2/3/4